jgi:hypothetical protein
MFSRSLRHGRYDPKPVTPPKAAKGPGWAGEKAAEAENVERNRGEPDDKSGEQAHVRANEVPKPSFAAMAKKGFDFSLRPKEKKSSYLTRENMDASMNMPPVERCAWLEEQARGGMKGHFQFLTDGLERASVGETMKMLEKAAALEPGTLLGKVRCVAEMPVLGLRSWVVWWNQPEEPTYPRALAELMEAYGDLES